jgi:transposase
VASYEWPEIGKGKRVTGNQREEMGRAALARYNEGASIRDIAEDSGRSIGFVRNLLIDAGVTFRGRGGATRRKAS